MVVVGDIAGFDWDAGNQGKCQKHGVSLQSVESAFRGAMAVFPDLAHSQNEGRFIGIGKTDEGRSIFVAFTLRDCGGWMLIRPISARYMHKKEVEHYEKTFPEVHQ